MLSVRCYNFGPGFIHMFLVSHTNMHLYNTQFVLERPYSLEVWENIVCISVK